MDDKWHEKFVTVLGVNAWAPEWYPHSITEFDADTIAAMVEEAGATVGATLQGFSQDHFGVSFFPSAFGHRHANLAPGRDHVQEYSEALHRRGIRFFAYYCFQDRYLWDRQPDWRQKDANGADTGHVNFGDLCPNSPYREHVITRIGEINREYEVDGWLLDMLEFARNPPGCFCQYCRRKYRESFGLELPGGRPVCSEDWLRFVQWRYKCIEELLQDIVAEVKKDRPDCVFTHNAFAFRGASEWASGEDYEQLFQYDDVVTNIPSWDFGGREKSRYVDMIWQAGLYTWAFRGLSGKPVWMQFGRFPYDRDYQCQPEQELAVAAYSVVTNGGSPFVIDNVLPEGTLDRAGAARVTRVLKSLDAKKAWFDYESEVTFVAVLHSCSSNTWTDLAHPGETRYLRSFEGVCKALAEGHVPYQVIGERGITKDALSKYKVVVCPQTTVMNEEVADALEEYVREGGGLVAMGAVALYGSNWVRRDNSALASVLGADVMAPLNHTLSYLVPVAEHTICAELDSEVEFVAVRDSNAVRLRPHESSEVVALAAPAATEVVAGQRVFTYSMVDTPPHKYVKEPGVVANHHGKGPCGICRSRHRR